MLFVPLQGFCPAHLGAHYLDLVDGIGRMLDEGPGDPLGLDFHMLSLQVFDTVKVSKAKTHAADCMVEQLQVRSEDKFGSDQS